MSSSVTATRTRPRALVVRTDSDGDVLLSGPAVRAVAASAAVTLLVSPAGAAAARLLPGVDEVLVAPAPWSGYAPPPVRPAQVDSLVAGVRAAAPEVAAILTSFHQSPLPVALLLRMAGVGRIVGASADYPGSLLDVRLPAPEPSDPRHEVQRCLDIVAAAGFDLPEGDTAALAVRAGLPWPDAATALPRAGYVVLHPGASVTSRGLLPEHAVRIAGALRRAGRDVVVTGSASELALTRRVAAGSGARHFGGRTTLPEFGALLAAADCCVVGNTGPAHLAAAVGTPVVSLFSPVVPARWWGPWHVPHVLLGDHMAACAGSRARDCPVPGHPCLSSIDPELVVAAVARLTARRHHRTGCAGRRSGR